MQAVIVSLTSLHIHSLVKTLLRPSSLQKLSSHTFSSQKFLDRICGPVVLASLSPLAKLVSFVVHHGV